MRELKAQLKHMKTRGPWNPDAGFVARGKDTLLSVIRSSRRDRPMPESALPLDRLRVAAHLLFPSALQHALRPAFGIFVVGAVAISGWIATVSAAYNSIPGDALYQVKRAAEKTQEAVVSVTGSRSDKAQLHLEFATRRAQEVKQVLAQKNESSGDKKEAVAVAVDSLEKSIATAKDSVNEANKKEPEQTLVIAQEVNQKSSEIVSALQEVSKDSATSANPELVKKVAEAAKLVNDTGIAAVEAVVEKQASGDISATDAKDVVTKQIEAIAESSKAVNAAAANVQTIASSTVVTLLIASSTPSLVVTTTVSGSHGSSAAVDAKATADAASASVVQAVQKVTETAAAAQGAIQEAKNLVESNQLFKAIQEVKKANEATQGIQQVVDEVQKVVQAAKDVKEAMGVTGAPTGAATTTITVTTTVSAGAGTTATTTKK